MILVCLAGYHGPTDTVQVASQLLEDDGSSAAPRLQQGRVELLHRDTVMFTEEFDSSHVVLWAKDEDDEPADDGRFFMFLVHPPAQAHLNARVSVAMNNGEETAAECPVEVLEPNAQTRWQNPMLPGREPTQYEKDPRFP